MEEVVLDDGSWGDDLDDVALDESLGGLGVFHLLGDGDLEAAVEESCDVGLDGVVGDAAHGDAGACGEDDIHDGGGGLGVVEEEFVEVAHAEEEDGVRRQFLLGLHILSHGGGELFGDGGGHMGRGCGSGGGSGQGGGHGPEFGE